jgi:hypothetical protein
VDTSAYEAIPVGDITNKGLMFGRNLDASNYVQIKSDTGSTTVAGRINPGKPFLWQWEPGAALKWKANSADVKVLLHLCEV